MPRLCILLPILAVLTTGARLDDRYEPTSIYYTEPTTLVNTSVISNNNGLHELHGGSVVHGERILLLSKSPYLLREDLFIEKDGKLVIEPGVEIRFGPMVGITIRGIISAKVMINNRISKKKNRVESMLSWRKSEWFLRTKVIICQDLQLCSQLCSFNIKYVSLDINSTIFNDQEIN